MVEGTHGMSAEGGETQEDALKEIRRQRLIFERYVELLNEDDSENGFAREYSVSLHSSPPSHPLTPPHLHTHTTPPYSYCHSAMWTPHRGW